MSRSKVSNIKRYFIMFLGAFSAAVGLELFLVPNQIIDGGVVGISIMLNYLTNIPISIFLVGLNLPFLYLGYRQIGFTFSVSTIFSILCLAGWLAYFKPIPVVTSDLFLAAVFGGVMVGLGTGLIVRASGSLDGTEIVAILLDKKTGFSVGEIVGFINLFILGASGFVFSWEKAMYSLVTYFVASKVIDIAIVGLDETKGVWIVTNNPDEIADALMARLGRGVTIFEAEGGYTGHPRKVLYSVITRLEIAKLKTIISEKDEDAFITINPVHETLGGRIKKRAIH